MHAACHPLHAYYLTGDMPTPGGGRESYVFEPDLLISCLPSKIIRTSTGQVKKKKKETARAGRGIYWVTLAFRLRRYYAGCHLTLRNNQHLSNGSKEVGEGSSLFAGFHLQQVEQGIACIVLTKI